MKYISTREHHRPVDFRTALLTGLAPDGGLYVPQSWPDFHRDEVMQWMQDEIPVMAGHILHPFVDDHLSIKELHQICADVLSFDIPIRRVSEEIAVLELFHGPTKAFKDVGARFMSRIMGALVDAPLTILVATSGDTGGAVAQGFHQVPNVQVRILYPRGGVSDYQEQQIAGLGDNILAIEVDGTFDDCQALVKQAFNDTILREACALTSANSINIGRLLPQMLYYYIGMKQLRHGEEKITFCVPSGNLGNLTSGLYAQKLHLGNCQFLAASNANTTFDDYMRTGNFSTRPTIQTLSNAMDVSVPSNLERINHLFHHDVQSIRSQIRTQSVTDESTVDTIARVYDRWGYVLDPHTAVGWHAAEQSIEPGEQVILLATADPIKFHSVVQQAIPGIMADPVSEAGALVKVSIANDYSQLRDILSDI